MIIYFCLCLLVCLKGTEILKIFIPVMLFYGNKNNVCLGFVRWFLYTLLLLKTIFSMKRCYVYVWGMG